MSNDCTSTACETRTAVQQPAYNTREDESGVHLQVALPGVAKDAVKLTLKDSVLQIEGTRKTEVPADWKAHSSFPGTVSYQLNVRLTQKLDGGNVQASLDNGVLTVKVPVREESKPRQISVN